MAAHPSALPIEKLLEACEFRQQRRSGPGGQHRNKVSTGIFLKHLPSGLEVSASERRRPADNRRMAIQRLRVRLACLVRRPTPEGAGASNLWSSRRMGNRIVVSARHVAFPALLAEALDMLAASDYDMAAAAVRLECSRSSLTSLIRQESRAWELLNAERLQRGFRPLK